MYSLTPSSNPSLNHRIELLPSTVKFQTGTNNKDFTEFSLEGHRAQNTTKPIRSQFKVSLNLDKNFLTSQLKSIDSRRRYIESLSLQSHLISSYFHHTHQIRLQFVQINIDDFTDFYQPSQKTHLHHPNLFNIDPSKFLTKTSLNVLLTEFQKSKPNSDPLIHIYLVPKYLLNKSDQDGISSVFEPRLPCQSLNAKPSTILLKDKYSIEQQEFDETNDSSPNKRLLRSIKPGIEQANLIIDLIGQSLGRVNTNQCHNIDSTKFNWHFQVSLNFYL